MIGIIIPTFREKENILKLSKKLLKLHPNCLIFIVDDTKEYNLKNYFKDKKKITYIYRKNKKGRGSAVIEGFKKAYLSNKIKIFVEMDADFSHEPRELKNNINKFKNMNLDLLIASRYLKNSKIYNWSIQRRIFSFMANFLAEILLNVGVSDYTNGYRIYSRRALKIVISKCGKIGDGFIVLSEFLLQLKLHNYKISETSSIFVNRTRGESSVNLSLILQSLLGLFKLYFIKLKANNKKLL
tara:strand:+ start:4665 stop:5387 length:723 start_codon:yes stop_codon:yes gene_type:complete